MEAKRAYFLGLDLGTGSVGWCVTDTKYHILKANRKRTIGSVLFFYCGYGKRQEELCGAQGDGFGDSRSGFNVYRNCSIKKYEKLMKGFSAVCRKVPMFRRTNGNRMERSRNFPMLCLQIRIIRIKTFTGSILRFII